MTLETRSHTGWRYRAPGVNALIEGFMADRTEEAFPAFFAAVRGELSAATAKDEGTYGDYGEMLEEQERVVDFVLGSCSGVDTMELMDAYDELFFWADTYDVFLGR